MSKSGIGEKYTDKKLKTFFIQAVFRFPCHNFCPVSVRFMSDSYPLFSPCLSCIFPFITKMRTCKERKLFMGNFIAHSLSLILTVPSYNVFRKTGKFCIKGFCVFFFAMTILFASLGEMGIAQEKNADLPVLSPSFHKFLSGFADSRTEQLKRVKFPLASVSLNEEDEEKTVMIQKQDWQFRDLSGYANCLVYVYDTFEPDDAVQAKGVSTEEFMKLLSQPGMQVDKSLKNNGKRRIHFKGIEHGVSYSLYFQLIGNEWYLVREEDFSM